MFEVKYWDRDNLLRKKKVNLSRYSYLCKPPVYRLFVAQLCVTLFLFFITIIFNIHAAISVLAGGLCCTIPNAYLVWKVFRYRGARAAKKIVTCFYQGELGKFLLTISGFLLIFTWIDKVVPVALFGAFIIVQSIHWLTPLLIGQRQRKDSN